MERWLTIDEYMDTFLGMLTALSSIGSLVFVGMGYYLAKDYLSQHREKVKEEHKQKLIVEAIKTIIKLKSDSISYYAIIDDEPLDDSNLQEIDSHVRHVVQRHRALAGLRESINSCHFDLTALSKILNISEISESIQRLNKLLDFLESTYKKISQAAFENDLEGAYEITKELEFYRNHGNQKAPINLLISLLSLLIDDLLIIYWAKN